MDAREEVHDELELGLLVVWGEGRLDAGDGVGGPEADEACVVGGA